MIYGVLAFLQLALYRNSFGNLPFVENHYSAQNGFKAQLYCPQSFAPTLSPDRSVGALELSFVLISDERSTSQTRDEVLVHTGPNLPFLPFVDMLFSISFL